MNVKNIIDKGLAEIVKNPAFDEFPKHFLFNDTLEQNALLFIGINPSSEEGQLEYASYQLDQKNNKHPYFKKFEAIAAHCKLPWTHLDLLFFRETNQNTIHEILKKKNGLDYIWKQLKLADELIKLSNPQVIVVCNTLARKFLGKDKSGNDNVWLDYEFIFDDKIGTHTWNDIPVFFSGMLSGQRALDLGSYERMQWQIERAVIFNTLKEIDKQKALNIENGRIEEAAKLNDTKKYYLRKVNFES